jgi:hypothetical protein
MMTEKRAQKRVDKYFAINIVAVDSDGKTLRFDGFKANPKFCDETGLDFSPSGAKMMCSKPLPKESKIQMKMLLPDNDSLNLVKANGSIKWFKQVKGKHKKFFLMGVHFRDLTSADKSKLIRLWKKYSAE